MKKINSIKLKRFNESAEGKEAIELFSKAYSANCTVEDLILLVDKYDPDLLKGMNNYRKTIVQQIQYFKELINNNIANNTPSLETSEDLEHLFIDICFDFLFENYSEEIEQELLKKYEVMPECISWEDIPQKFFKVLLSCSLPFSLSLYSLGKDTFMPNLFLMQFAYMRRFAENYEIDLPEVPHRADYKQRCEYYLDLCQVLTSFFQENGITNMPEICAYLFAYEFPEIKGELESEQRPMPKNPEQIWLLVGNLRDGEKHMKRGFWQGSPMIRRGDLCLFYEKTPIKAMNAAWIAQEDGVVDPFFLYYSNTYIGNRIEFPGIAFEEFKNNEYFSKLRVDNEGKDLPGNYVKKNFQDCSGWPITAADYEEIKKLLAAKGFDPQTLPQLPVYEPIEGVNIRLESDVTEQLLMPMLDRMGFEFNKDYFREVEFPAGHGETGYGLDKRPDVCLHMTGSGKNKGAQVVIEMKLDMSSLKKLEEAFDQGLTYAKYGEARIFCIADQAGIYVFERSRNNKFSLSDNTYFKWEELTDNDKFIQLKRLFEKH